ncbi:hypothetical protein Xoosp13_345 [Xanthomonas phage Xoo-sp13]|nr:hypothetical protein Xoosp13_345 [Xanthomonas phage Xoo-sp13]
MIFVSRLIRYGVSPVTGVNYTREELERMIARWKDTENERPIFGTLNTVTPKEIDVNEPFVVNLDEVATKIIDMYLDDEGLIVHQEILDTVSGNKVLGAIELEEEYPELIGGTLTVNPNIAGSLTEDKVAEGLRLLSTRFSIRVK